MEIRYLFPILFQGRLSFYLGRFERERERDYLTNWFGNFIRWRGRNNIEGERSKRFALLHLWGIFIEKRFFDYRSDDIINDKVDIYGNNVCFEDQPERKTILLLSRIIIKIYHRSIDIVVGEMKTELNEFRSRENEIGENLSLIFLSSSFNHLIRSRLFQPSPSANHHLLRNGRNGIFPRWNAACVQKQYFSASQR